MTPDAEAATHWQAEHPDPEPVDPGDGDPTDPAASVPPCGPWTGRRREPLRAGAAMPEPVRVRR